MLRVGKLGETHRRQCRVRPLDRPAAAENRRENCVRRAEHGAHHDVFADSHAVECRRRLKHARHAQMADAMGRRRGDVVTGEDYFAGIGRNDTRDHIE